MEKVKNIFKYKCNNKLYIFFKYIATTIFALTIFWDSLIKLNTNKIHGTLKDIYFTNINFKNIMIGIISWVITFTILTIIELLVSRIEKNYYIKNENKPKKKRVFFLVFGIIILLWMPYILTYFPGGIFADTKASILQCIHLMEYDNANPIVYTLLIKVFLKIGDLCNSPQIGINAFGIFQITVMAAVLAYFVYWLYKKNFSYFILAIITLFFGIFKLFPLYALSIWKDTPFCLVLFLYIINIAEIVTKKGKNLNEIKELIIYSLLMIAVSFLRNNGFYVIIATTFVVFVVYRKNKILKFGITALITIILIYAVKGPLFTTLGLNKSSGSWNSVMLNQIFYVSVTDGNMTEEESEFINTMCDRNKLKEVYTPLLFDTLTPLPEFNYNFIVTHNKEIKKIWIKLLIKNPKAYLEAYSLNTLGFWDTTKAFKDAYTSHTNWKKTEDIINAKQTDYIKEWTGTSIKDYIDVKIRYSSAIFIFLILFSMLYTIQNKRYKNLIIYLPAIFVWGTIMLATPIAFSMRYVYILVLMVPFDFIIPFLKENEQYKEDRLTLGEGENKNENIDDSSSI